ncbi:hypothetical protein FQN57_001055 [Myotisia sp. PD_48]|nr:hypothetical protein FQN57_001055 [Myotisia sp. PD_48]
MHFPLASLVLLSVPLLSAARELCNCQGDPPKYHNNMLEAIKYVAPTATGPDGLCRDTSTTPGQCRSAHQAVLPFTMSLQKYNVTNGYEIAALLSLIVLESGEFKYQRNLNPANKGQGTRNMQMAQFNKEYAASIPEIRREFEPIKNDPAAVLNLLLTRDEYDFGTAAWYLTTKCDAEVRKQLQTGSRQGWEEHYLRKCIGAPPSEARFQYWKRAMEKVPTLE